MLLPQDDTQKESLNQLWGDTAVLLSVTKSLLSTNVSTRQKWCQSSGGQPLERHGCGECHGLFIGVKKVLSPLGHKDSLL